MRGSGDTERALAPEGKQLHLQGLWTSTSLYMESWATGFSTMHLYLPICSQARLGSVMFASEKLKRDPLWTQWYLGPRREVETHSIRTRLPISADRMPLMWWGQSSAARCLAHPQRQGGRPGPMSGLVPSSLTESSPGLEVHHYLEPLANKAAVVTMMAPSMFQLCGGRLCHDDIGTD